MVNQARVEISEATKVAKEIFFESTAVRYDELFGGEPYTTGPGYEPYENDGPLTRLWWHAERRRLGRHRY